MPREPGPTTDGARPTNWTGRDALLFLGVFAVALGIRLVYLGQIESFPLFEHPTFDGRRYVAWARDARRCRKRAGADEGARGQ